jgi:hypothetical protein
MKKTFGTKLISSQTARLSVLLSFVVALASVARAEERHFSWQKDPGPIAGHWSVTCKEMSGMVVEFSVDGKRATGRISTLGNGGFRNYSNGEEIIRLEADDYGDWVGKLHVRGADASARWWDSVRFVASAQQLNGTMTMDTCYNNMSRTE